MRQIGMSTPSITLANRVEKGFIRVEADECLAFYVMLRYEIEKQLFNGDLDVDVPPQHGTACSNRGFGMMSRIV